MLRLLLLIALLALPSLATAGSLTPEVAVTAETAEGTAARINLEAVNADVKTVLRTLAEVGKFNVMFDDGATGRVTVSLRDVPIDQAAAVIAQSVGLTLVDLGNVRMVRSRR